MKYFAHKATATDGRKQTLKEHSQVNSHVKAGATRLFSCGAGFFDETTTTKTKKLFQSTSQN